MRRRTLLVVLVVLAVLVAAGVVLMWPKQRASPVTVQNYEQIRVSVSSDPAESMSRPEVVRLLGPPGDYTTRPTVTPSMTTGFFTPFIGDERERRAAKIKGDYGMEFSPAIFVLFWQGDDLTISVVFDASHRVYSKRWVKNEPAKVGSVETLVWRAKRQWRRWFP
jgi:hypothetical protein